MNICVFCASSDGLPDRYHAAARALGKRIGASGHTLVYGGGNVGLMGTLARAVHAKSGRVVGYIPRRLQSIEGRAYDIADELHVTETMAERKRGMYELADVFVVLPGGIGTLEEFFEVLTLRKLGYHSKPIYVLNTDRCHQPLIDLLRHADKKGFSPGVSDGDLYRVIDTPEELWVDMNE